jgi:hypothetical protein
MEGVKSLELQPEELPGVEGSERSDGGGGELGRPSPARRPAVMVLSECRVL